MVSPALVGDIAASDGMSKSTFPKTRRVNHDLCFANVDGMNGDEALGSCELAAPVLQETDRCFLIDSGEVICSAKVTHAGK